ncbi:MAG: SirB1 family protein, partial [Planctomycetia bacterium]
PEDGLPGDDVVDLLRAEGAAARTGLLARAADLERQATRLETLAATVHARQTLDELGSLVHGGGGEGIDLFHAALLLARLDNPDLDVDASRRELDRLAADIRGRVPEAADDEAVLAVLNRVLFDELGFHGSRGDYYNRANSYVNEVLDDREGIPISLAVVYMELARRLGLTVEGVGFPGHFLVRFTPGTGEPRWLDVFERAAVCTRDELAAKRRDAGEELGEADLAVVGPRAILARMANNLLGIARREGRQDDVLRYLDAILTVSPDSGTDRVMRMVTAARLGRRAAALVDARWLLEHEPEGIDLEQVRGFVARLEAGE